MDFFTGLGLFGLFLGSFLAGSIIPFSSEVLFGSMMLAGFDPVACLISTSLGNTLGGMTCYYIGRLGKMEWMTKYLKVKEATLHKYTTFLHGKGAWMGFFAWLPYAGEAIAIALGFLRANTLIVLISMFIGKTLRYLIMMLIIQGVIA